jgi:hypothetical protein
MKKFIFYIFLLTSTKLFADININASVDRTTVNFGESITLQVEVSGDVASVPKPTLPQLTDFNVYSSGTSQNVSFVNGRVSSSITYSFVLSPNKPGKYVINPVSLTVGGKTYSTNPINVEVLASGIPQPQKQVDKQQLKVDEDEARGVFVTAQLDKQKVYVNEGIVYTFRFFASRNLLSNPEYKPPNFTGFIVEDLPPQKNYQTIINGKRYNVIEIKTELFATAPGTYNLGDASLRVSVEDFNNQNPFNDDFFNGMFGSGKTSVVKSKSLTVEVMPLPSDNKPANFSGTVGNYSLNVSADKSQCETGNPITLTVNVSGEGNVKSISEPKFPNIIGVRKYDTISSVNISKANYKVSGSKVFKMVIVPERVGNLVIPEFEFAYFSPDKKEYKKIKSAPLQIKIIQSKGGKPAGLPAVASGINIVSQDIRFIKTDLGKNSKSRLNEIISDVLLVVSPLIFLCCLGYNRYNYFVSKNYSFIKSKRAFKKFNEDLNNLQKKSVNVKDFYGILFDLIIRYFSDKTKEMLSGCTFNEIENILKEKKLSQDDIGNIKNILEEADFIRFTPLLSRNINLKEEADKIRLIIQQIDKRWKI